MISGRLSGRIVLLSTAAAASLTPAAPAFAQPQDDDPGNPPVQSVPPISRVGDDVLGQPQEEEAIIVTGSRIQRRDLTSTSPLAVIQDEEFRLSGAVNVEQVINTLPQVVPGASAFDNNPGGGVATLDLRGVGTTRTLILVNGRRWMFYDTAQVVDLNTIPQFLIDSVDVVTGGASAVYGSDAIAGVVNFRLKDDLEGVVAGGQYSITEEGDGRRYNLYAAFGAPFADGRGNVTVYGEYFNRGAIFQGDRDFSFFALVDSQDGTALVPGGSATTPLGHITVAPTAVAGRPVDLNGDGDTTDPGEVPTLPRGVGSFGTSLGGIFLTPGMATPRRDPQDLYNYAPANYLMVPQERWLLGGYAEYEVNDWINAFAEVSFINNRVANELAPTPIGGTFNLDVEAVCAYLSAGDCATLRQIDENEAAINAARAAEGLAPLFGTVAGFGVLDARDPGVVQVSINRRITETGSRNSLDERNAFRVLTGLNGNLAPDLNYEVYYLYARTRNSNQQAGNISRSAFQSGVETGTLNIYGGGTLSRADVNSISILAQNSDISQLQVANASISGLIGNFGWGADDIGFATGLEWRSVSAEFIPDTALASGDVVGFNAGNPTEGRYDVKEAFAELRIPIVGNMPGFHRLELSGAARYSDYSLEAVGGTWTYAAGAEFAPVRDITFRAQYQRAVRAPNVGELFGGLANGFPPATDPCSDRGPAANRTDTVRQLCFQTGVPVGSEFMRAIQPNTQIEAQFGGNPDLGEETSDTWTVGAVIQPSFIPRLAITVDYFNIKIEDFISTFGGGLNNTLNLCYNIIQDINSPYCQVIRRDPNTGVMGGQFLTPILNANIASLETSGVDFQVDYSQPLGFSAFGAGESRLNFYFLGTWNQKNDFTPVVDQPDIVNECAGSFGLICDEPQPEYKWTTRISWIDGPATVSLRWRHLSSVTDDDPTTNFVVEELAAFNLWDLSFAFDVGDNLTLNMGVSNLFDTYPELIGDNQEQANTYPNVYTPIGRDYFVSANFRF